MSTTSARPVMSLADEAWVAPVRAGLQAAGRADQVEIVHWGVDGPAPRDDIDVVVLPQFGAGRRSLARMSGLTRLRAVQVVSAGYDHILAHVPEGVSVHNGTGIHDASTADLALALTLGVMRDLPGAVERQREQTWGPLPQGLTLHEARVLVIGCGAIGRAIVQRVAGFGARVTVAASRARGGDDLVDRVHGVDELPALLPEHDVVILIVPLTEATRGLVDAGFLAAMPDGALLVNVARGPVVDTEALTAEVLSGRLRAGLDVTDPEPLPDGHPLYSAPGVLITPHIAGLTARMGGRITDFLTAQALSLATGEPLANEVRPAAPA